MPNLEQRLLSKVKLAGAFTLAAILSCIRQVPEPESIGYLHASVSPDGSKIAYVSGMDSGKRDINIMDFDGTNEECLTNN